MRMLLLFITIFGFNLFSASFSEQVTKQFRDMLQENKKVYSESEFRADEGKIKRYVEKIKAPDLSPKDDLFEYLNFKSTIEYEFFAKIFKTLHNTGTKFDSEFDSDGAILLLKNIGAFNYRVGKSGLNIQLWSKKVQDIVNHFTFFRIKYGAKLLSISKGALTQLSKSKYDFPDAKQIKEDLEDLKI